MPQLIGGTTPRAAERAAELFRLICPRSIFLKPIEAELAKLFCNAWRYINFAISNQFYVMAEQFEADFHRIYGALREDYPRMQSFARPGFAAGPCLRQGHDAARRLQSRLVRARPGGHDDQRGPALTCSCSP